MSNFWNKGKNTPAKVAMALGAFMLLVVLVSFVTGCPGKLSVEDASAPPAAVEDAGDAVEDAGKAKGQPNGRGHRPGKNR